MKSVRMALLGKPKFFTSADLKSDKLTEPIYDAQLDISVEQDKDDVSLVSDNILYYISNPDL
ncbi:hypothetical protein MAR_003195 [Mya arenaria]|uniref:Uncharacterized protein n=1 Tax=Mya arenaria TaxID=6604 RepID=A0ABY7G6Q3_MYAAR|nr:hypothetical protein MAR_003195 [Mya arenaria]